MTKLTAEESATVARRLSRVEGQVAGIHRMVDDGRDCEEIVTQIAAALKALERVGFTVIAGGLRQCVRNPGPDPKVETERLERLFLSLA